MNTIAEIIDEKEYNALVPALENKDPKKAQHALLRSRKGPHELALLLSPGADAILDEICEQARHIAMSRVGRAIQLYAPLYLSNHCIGCCPYCGFGARRSIERRTLSSDEIASEARILKDTGLQHILLVAGEAPKQVDIDYLVAIVRRLRRLIPSVAVEVAPLSTDDYRALVAAGVDGVTLYQETYDQQIYVELHRVGPKADYYWRLEALDRAGAAGIRKLTAGALWGLAPWRHDALRLGLHLRYLQRRWWRSQVSFGVPRLRRAPNGFSIEYPLDARSLVHLIVVLRVYLGDVGVALSTRESSTLRDQLVGLGVTQMSAGSRTAPGGYGDPGSAGDQFMVYDERSPVEVAEALLALGYDPVWKDWDAGLGANGIPPGGTDD